MKRNVTDGNSTASPFGTVRKECRISWAGRAELAEWLAEWRDFSRIVVRLLRTPSRMACPEDTQRLPYKMTQHELPSLFSNVSSAARVAASNTSSTPSPLRLEHSR